MASKLGHFDDQGNACLKFSLCGVAHKEPGLEFTGIIDTGFTGFIQIPIQNAFALKLPLDGTVKATLADGSASTCLTGLAKVTFEGVTTVGTVMLEFNGQDILIGMDFLRVFKLSLIVAKGAVLILDEDWLEKAGKAYEEGMKTQKAQEAATSSSPSEPAPPAEQFEPDA